MTDCKNCNYTDEYCASGDCTSQSPRNDLAITSQVSDLTEQWVNIYKSKKYGDSYWTGTFCYKTKEEAVKDLADKENYLTTVNIEDMLNLQTQNAQLKELLKEIRGKIKTVYDMDLNQFITSAVFTDDFVKKIDEVLNA